jgi:hypothetical protein
VRLNRFGHDPNVSYPVLGQFIIKMYFTRFPCLSILAREVRFIRKSEQNRDLGITPENIQFFLASAFARFNSARM